MHKSNTNQRFVIRWFVAACELSFAVEQAGKGLIQVSGRTCCWGWTVAKSTFSASILDSGQKNNNPSVAKPPAAPGLLRRRRDGGITSPQLQGAMRDVPAL